MKLKKFIILYCALIISISTIGCRKIKEAVFVQAVGSTAYVSSVENMPFKIDSLDITSIDNFFCFNEYVSHENGTNYKITDCNNKVIGIIKLAKKSDVYSSKEWTVDLLKYEYSVIYIPETINKINLVGGLYMPVKELTICVEPRTTPLDLSFTNVNIGTFSSNPVIINPTAEDINIIIEGINYIEAGNEPPHEEDLTILDYLEGAHTVLNTPYQVYGIAKDWMKEAAINGAVSAVTGGDYITGFYNSMADSQYESLEMTKKWLDAVMNQLEGSPGVDGPKGASAIMSLGQVAIYGQGSAYIKGGKGFDGTDARWGLFGSFTKIHGGEGGNGGDAIESPVIINISNGKCILEGGNGGYGGKGYTELSETFFESNGKNGNQTLSIYYHSFVE